MTFLFHLKFKHYVCTNLTNWSCVSILLFPLYIHSLHPKKVRLLQKSIDSSKYRYNIIYKRFTRGGTADRAEPAPTLLTPTPEASRRCRRAPGPAGASARGLRPRGPQDPWGPGYWPSRPGCSPRCRCTTRCCPSCCPRRCGSSRASPSGPTS